MITHGSLFTGLGGFDLAFERHGVHTLYQVEKDPAARSVLAYHWPDTPRFDDVCDVGRHNLPYVDIISGGFPCQDLSVVGKRGGLSGERSGLFYEMARVIDECKPKFIIFENVPGIFSSDQGRDFGRVINTLADIGYCGAYRVLDARYFGVPQRRRRVFGVFARADIGAGCCAEILAVTESVPGNTQSRRKAQQDTARRTTYSTEKRGYNGTGVDDGTFAPPIAPPVVAGNEHAGISAGFPTLSVQRQVAAIDVRNLVMNPDISGTLQAKKTGGYSLSYTNPIFTIQHAQIGRKDEAGPQDKGWQEDVAFTIDSRSESDVVAFSSKDYGADAGALSPTLRAMNYDRSHINGGGQVAIATQHVVRRLTPRECERLQGFPDDWTRYYHDGREQSDSNRYRQIGNAVAVPVVEWIARRIVRQCVSGSCH